MLPKAIRICLLCAIQVLIAIQLINAQAIIGPVQVKVCNLSSTQFRILSAASSSNFRWQDSTSTGWLDLSNNAFFQGVNNDTLQISNASSLLNGLKFRCIVDSAGFGLKFDTSNLVQLFVRDSLLKPVISSNQVVCFGNLPDTLRVVQPASGGDSIFSYQWQKSINGSTWQNVTNSDSSKLPLDTLSSSLYFRLMATSNALCGTVVSDSVFIKLAPKLVKPQLFLNKQTVCYQGSPDSLLILNPQFLDIHYQWQISNDSVNFIDLLNDTSYIKSSIQSITSKVWFRLKSSSKSNCGVLYSDTAVINNYSPVIKPSISGTQTICFEDVPDTLFITTPNNMSASVKFQWQTSVNGNNWLDIPAETSKQLVLSKNGTTKFYRVKITWPSNCGVVFTDSVLVSVYSQFNQGVIRPNQNICFNSIPATFSFQTITTGGGDSYFYQWQESNDSINFTNIPGANTTIYQSPALSFTKFYRVLVQSTNGCGTLYTNSIKVGVYPKFVGPDVIGNDTICYNTRPDTLKISTVPIGGNGNYTYQWQQSTNSNTWLNISGAFANKLKPQNLILSTYYRLITMAGPACGIDTSNVLFIKVWPNLVKARISSSQSICYNTSADTLRITQLPTGGNGKFNYHWQSSVDGLNWINVLGQTSTKMSTGKLTQTTYYRIKAISTFGCSEISSDSVKITVFENLTAGTIDGNQTICYNTAPSKFNISINASGGGSLYAFQWQVSNDSINFTDIPNANLVSLQIGSLISSKFYRLKVTSSLGCGFVYTNIIKVKVYEKFVGAKIGDSHKICYGYIPVPLYTKEAPHGGSGIFEYQWQSSLDSINWNTIQGANASSLPMVESKVTMFYRLINWSTFSCGIDTSNTVEIFALKLPDTTALVGPSNVCRNQQELFYSLENSNVNYSYEWSISKGKVLTNNTKAGVFISWNDEAGVDTIYVKQTNKITLCFNFMKFPITLKTESAPSKTEIVRKANSNILVCKDTSAGIHYQWGYIEKANSSYFDIPNANQRYIQLPHTFDTSLYIYYVKTWFTDCITNTYYNFNPTFLGFNEVKTNDLAFFPNPSNGIIHFEGSDIEEFACYNLIGEQVEVGLDRIEKSLIFSYAVPGGLYLFKLKTKNGVVFKKVILNR